MLLFLFQHALAWDGDVTGREWGMMRDDVLGMLGM